LFCSSDGINIEESTGLTTWNIQNIQCGKQKTTFDIIYQNMKTIPLTKNTKRRIFEPTPVIKRAIKKNFRLITKIEKDFQIPDRYLIPHLAIHLPKFKEENLNQKTVSQEAIRLAKKIQGLYKNLSGKWESLLYQKKKKIK
jgi:hypothetical protein